MDVAKRFLVSGKVQGVFFRASTAAEAQRLGLRGHARNRADGRVEVLAAGSSEAIAQLAQWLRHGPAQARVDDVRAEDADPDDAGTGFATR
jgi:acylphosphatase